MVFMGTLVARGKMEAVVVGTGLNTELGLVAAQLKGMKEQPSHYEKRTAQLSKIMAITAVILGLVTFAVGYWWRGFELFEMVTYTVATLVSALPESLPIILVVVLALGAVRMAKKHAIVRKLSATETLGVVSVIITDKTGTLTQNVMSVGAVAIPGSGVITVGGKVVIADFGLVKKIAVLGTGVEKVMKHGEGEVLTGDPTEVALYSFGMTGPAAYLSGYEKIQDLPFDPKLKLRASLVKGEAEASPELFVVGAPEVVMRKCTAMVTATGKKMLCNEKIAQEMLNELASKGMRTVGLAIRKVPKGTKKIDIKTQLQELTMVGVVGLYDPPREEVAPALRAGAKAGIHIVMATGDHPVTAGVIAQKIGLIPADISACVLTESEIEKMNDAQLWDELQTCQVLARLSPDSKLRVAGLFQDHGYVVAMTGDGVNDAPALKKADVGIAMGKVGTDVAREASDIVLADDNFATIINAIAEGRTQFSNVRRTTYFLLATNVSECAALLVTLLFGLPMPLLPLQILWLNVVATGITDIALATEPSHENVMDYPPRDPKEALITSRFMPLFVSITISMVIAVIGVFVWFLPQGVAYARTAAFITLSLAQLSNLFSMRSLRLSVLRIGLFSNKAVNIAVAVSLLLMLAATYTPYFNDIFSFKPLAFFEMMVIVAVAASIFLLTEVVKHFFAAGSRFTPTAFFVKPTGVRR
jgi:Ca2+-transporting ATPase